MNSQACVIAYKYITFLFYLKYITKRIHMVILEYITLEHIFNLIYHFFLNLERFALAIAC